MTAEAPPAATPPGADAVAARREAEALIVDVDGYEGPLDLLLALSRSQKVDLRRISVLALSEQYLAFVDRARALRIELAADYLVMAAWLAYLKSRLLLPAEPDDPEPSGEDLATHLAFQLQRLEAMRAAAADLMARDRKGRDFFARGQPQDATVVRRYRHTARLIDLMQAYARLRTRDEFRPYAFDRRDVYTLDEAMERMRGMLGTGLGWADLVTYLPPGWSGTPARRRAATAATFAAALELAKRGQVDLRQNETFAPIRVRPKGPTR